MAVPKTEAELQTLFTRWLRLNGCTLVEVAGAFELKLVKCAKGGGAQKNTCGLACSTRLSVSKVEEGQEVALAASAGLLGPQGGLAYKISDSGIGAKPYDCFYMNGVKAYLVIGWVCGRGGNSEEPDAQDAFKDAKDAFKRPRIKQGHQGGTLSVWALPIEAWRVWREALKGGRGALSEEEVEGMGAIKIAL